MKRYVGLVACSNGLSKTQEMHIDRLIFVLKENNIEVVISPYIYRDNTVCSASAINRADILNQMFANEYITDIFDISGGDIANEILPYLNFNTVLKSKAVFWGYSDLTSVINAMYSRVGKFSNLYQIRNILEGEDISQIFIEYIINGKRDLFNFSYEYIRGQAIEGIVVGGNIRCLLKLAGTGYMPDFRDKILLLESYSGDEGKIRTYITQLKQIGAFNNIRGILLGTFTEMEEKNIRPTVEEIFLAECENIPIIKTTDIGHSSRSRAIVIGERIRL